MKRATAISPAGLLFVWACVGPPGMDVSALRDGAAWVTRETPAALAGKVADYEHEQLFGVLNDPHGWRGTTRYSIPAGAGGGAAAAGCRFIEWIPGSWSVSGSILRVRTRSTDSGSAEVYDCTDGRPARPARRRPHFVEGESAFRLEGNTLVLERQFGSEPPYPVTLRRK